MRINLPILSFNLGLLYSLLTSTYWGIFFVQNQGGNHVSRRLY